MYSSFARFRFWQRVMLVVLSMAAFVSTADTLPAPPISDDPAAWSRSAVIYQIYPKSFKDTVGDGFGDLQGIRSKLPYLRELGAQALWISPFYRSPQADAGYDVSDYRDVDPMFGTLRDFDALITDAHMFDMKVIVDLVPNHTSDEHAWFQAALQSAPGSAERERYIFRGGSGEDGQHPPNDWQSVFGGRAWTRVANEDQWYLHMFDRKQPDLNWRNADVRGEFEQILRFWLDRGVDGFRVDVAHGLIKEEGLPDVGEPATEHALFDQAMPMWDQDEVHTIYRSWRQILDEYPGVIMVAEAWVPSQKRLLRYIRDDEMHQAFNFDYLQADWNAGAYKTVIDQSLQAVASVQAPSTWVTSNHDTVRAPSRLGLASSDTHTSATKGIAPDGMQPDEALGLHRARALALLTLALPGAVYIYQGEELGLPEHTTLDARYRQDPRFRRTEGEEVGRDGARIPLPWRADEPSMGFSVAGKTWLPQPESYAAYAVDQQRYTPRSTLAMYRAMIALRHAFSLGEGELHWLYADDDVLLFENAGMQVMINFGEDDVALPLGAKVQLASGPLRSRMSLPRDTAVWMIGAEKMADKQDDGVHGGRGLP